MFRNNRTLPLIDTHPKYYIYIIKLEKHSSNEQFLIEFESRIYNSPTFLANLTPSYNTSEERNSYIFVRRSLLFDIWNS